MTIIGAQYYRPPNPPRSDWPRDLRLMRDAGMNTVKFWACWSWINAEPGIYDFSDLDDLMALAEQNGLRVVVNTIIENAPYWLEERFPGSRYLDQEDRAIHLTAAMNTPGGGWPGLCFDNEEVWEVAADFLRAVVSRYGGHNSLLAWDVWNEPHLEPASYFPERMYCYCAASVAAFVAWLQRKYGDLSALNSSWARRYSSWDQVKPPRIFEAVPDLMDWRQFWFDNLQGWLARRVEVVRELSRDSVVMTHVALSGFTGQLATHTLDEFTLTEHVDAFGTSSFPTWLMDDDHVEHLFNLDTARDAAPGKPFWQAELQGGRGRRAGVLSTGQPRAEVTRLWMWNALATGAEGIMFWQWRPELLGPESPGYGLTTPNGSSTRRLEAASEMARIAQLPELVGRTVASSSVGLLISRQTALHAFATDRTMDLYTRSVMGAYRLLVDAGIAPVIVHEDQLVAGTMSPGIRSIYWPMPEVAGDSMIDRLVDFVETGGALVAEASPGEYDGRGFRRPNVPGGRLTALFGVAETETDAVSRAAELFRSEVYQGSWQVSGLTVEDAAIVETLVTAAPAITRREAGEGSATLLASYPSIAYDETRDGVTRDLVSSLLGSGDKVGATWLEQRPGLVLREALTADGRDLVFAINWTGSEATLQLGHPMIDPTVGQASSPERSFRVAPMSGRVFVSTDRGSPQ